MDKNEIRIKNSAYINSLDEYLSNNLHKRVNKLIISEKQLDIEYNDSCLMKEICEANDAPSKMLEKAIFEMDKSFSTKLIKLIDSKGLKDPDVYNKAQISRQLFNSIKNEVGYKPKKNTVLALLLALELEYDECKELLKTAGYSFSNSNKSDIIIKWCFLNKVYDINSVNELLYYYDQELLGSK